MTSTAPAAFELSREQDAFAEQLAGQFASVEVRRLSDGAVSCIGRDRLAPSGRDFQAVWIVGEDGPLDIRADLDRAAALKAAAVERVNALDPQDADSPERARDEARDLTRAYPQHDGRFDFAVLAVATREHSTKGGQSQQRGDLVLLMPREPGDGIAWRMVYSFRRAAFVSTPLDAVCEAVAR